MAAVKWIRHRPYYYYDTYGTYISAWKKAQWFKKRNKCRYYIDIVSDPFLPVKNYRLYLDKAWCRW